MKNVFKFILISVLLFLSVNNTLFAQEVILAPTETEQSQTYINSKIKKELKDSIALVYGKENVEEIYNNIIDYALKAKKARSKDLKEQDLNRADDWYKKEIIYMFYVDQFGVVKDNQNNTFKDTKKMFDYLSNLGVTTLYMLPFADSPMQDAGFDVKNPNNVRADLGGMIEFKDFIKEAKKRNFKIKADLVLNHFSDNHEWFKKLEKGDLEYLDYFVWRKTMPKYNKYQDEKLGTVIEYTEDDGTISKRRLIFPENTDTHYRKVTINNEDYYLYHTFYPFQLDINWQNPKVLYYVLETITNWANLGVDIFRMDAIPYLSKDVGTNGENQPKTHAIINIISDYIQLSAPSSVIQVEACQNPKDILEYFGKNRSVDVEINETKKPLKRTSEAQIAYHFPYMPAIWASLITEDKKYFIDAYKNTPEIPKSAVWGLFLRVHDELTLEMVEPEVRELIYNKLVNKGASFRKGFGVSGRLSNFLDKNPTRIEEAFSILFTLPGVPIIYYGDEAGVSNNFENAKKSAQLREKEQKNKKFKLISYFDSRDINRGNVPMKLFYGSSKGYYEFNSKVYKKVKNLINLRKQFPCLTDGSFEILKTENNSNFSYIRRTKNSQILVIHNLSDKKLTANITLPTDIIFKKKGHITSLKNLINNDNIKVDISLQNRTMHLRLSPYQTLWLEL